jgi:hypothetical protein
LKLTLPVTPGAGSKSNAPVAAFAETVPTPAIVVVMPPAEGETPLILPSLKVAV